MPKNTSTSSPQKATSEADELTERDLQERIYHIRGKQVLLDFDLAKFYGYSTKAFNQQVKNNLKKFEGEEFMFKLTKEESSRLRSIFLTLDSGRGKYFKYLPYAFTEQGVYMLMTVLRGDKAIEQSRTLVILFKKMKDYIIESQDFINYRENLQIATQVITNAKDILEVKSEINKMDHEIKNITDKISDAVNKSEISPILFDFSKTIGPKEFLIMNGEIIRAKDAIIEIYSDAKNKIHIIDNYVNFKTLRLLLEVDKNLEVIIYTSDANHYLKDEDIDEFREERPDVKIKFVKTAPIIHDRFIIVDEEKVYNLGASSKDIGGKITAIHEILDEGIKDAILKLVNQLDVSGKLA